MVAKTRESKQRQAGHPREVGVAVECVHRSKEKAKVTECKSEDTGVIAVNVRIAVVGARQSAVKRLNAKVHTCELLGCRKSDEMQASRRPQALRTQQNLLVCR